MTNNRFAWFRIIFFAIIGIAIVFVSAGMVLADTQSGSVTIQAQVGATQSSGGTSGGAGGSSQPVIPIVQPGPQISDVIANPTQVSALITFRATDSQPFSCYLDVGPTDQYTATIQSRTLSGLETVEITGLAASSTYFYRIRCTNILNQTSTYLQSFNTLQTDTEPPVITNVATSENLGLYTISWQATDNTIIDNCSFEYDRDGQVPFAFAGTVTNPAQNNYQTSLGNLVSNVIYYFRIICSDAIPNAQTVVGQFQTIRDAVPPPDVSNFRANSRNQSALLTWTYSDRISDVDSFVIRRSLGSAPATVLSGTAVATVPATSREFLDTGLINNTEYFYTIFVVDTSGNNSNGVSASTIPAVPGDRDDDSVPDDIDLCDANNPNQIDTPAGTIIDLTNGCPSVTVDFSDLTLWPQFLVTVQSGRLTPTIPAVRLRGSRVFTTGLQPGIWYLDYTTDNVPFTVAPNGQISWGSALDNTFSVSYSASGARLIVQGYLVRIDSRGVDPRNNFRIFSTSQSSAYLSDVAELHLYPKTYNSVNQNIAPFTLHADGTITWNSAFNNLYSRTVAFAGTSWHIAAFGDQTLRVTPNPLCVSSDTFTGFYRVVAPQGSTSFTQGTSLYHILPNPLGGRLYDVFYGAFPYIQSQSSGEQRNIYILLNPDRLYDSYDRETGNSINLTLNVQNVQASISTCSGPSRVCGNGILEFTEQCDDGNTRNNDGCSSFCTREVIALCGNGRINAGEACDDGNRLDHDGCSGLCMLEASECGNLFVETGETCDDGNVLNGDGCSSACQEEVLPVCGNIRIETGETCDDGNVLNGDGCSSACQTEFPAACSDNNDNDFDGFVDMADPGCSGPRDNSEFNVLLVTPTSTEILPELPEEETILEPTDSIVNFLIAERTLPVNLVNGTLYSLPGDQLTVKLLVPAQSAISSTIFEFAGNEFTLLPNFDRTEYTVDVTMPPIGRYDAAIHVLYENNNQVIIPFAVESLPYGVIENEFHILLSDAEVTLYDENGDIWRANQYRQGNPVYTGENGSYGFLVPNGRYTVQIKKDGYVTKRDSVDVSDNVFRQSETLVLASDGTVLGTIREFTAISLQFLGDTTEVAKRLFKNLKKIANDPKVKSVAENVVGPTAVVTVTVAVLPSLGGSALPLLQYFFFQPFLFFGAKKREKWGVVYNSISKLPVDLAILRLVNNSGKVVQSRVTDRAGRFIFFADQGDYSLQISRTGYIFPSQILQHESSDGSRVDLYHGGQMKITEDGVPLTPSIPIDPIGIEKSPWRLIWKKKLHFFQHVASLFGCIVSAGVFLLQPTILTGVMTLVQGLLYCAFLLVIKPKKPKQWGNIRDAATKKPVSKAIVRLFDKSYHKLVAMDVTGRSGRYAFLAGPNEYYIRVELSGYNVFESETVQITDQNGSFINNDIDIQMSN